MIIFFETAKMFRALPEGTSPVVGGGGQFLPRLHGSCDRSVRGLYLRTASFCGVGGEHIGAHVDG